MLSFSEAAKKLSSKEENTETAGALDPELEAYILERIEARKNAKAEKNYALADEIRAELLAKGITLTDTKEGTKFTIA